MDGAESGRGRTIPADAGKIAVVLFEGSITADHPRGCGENVLISVGIDAKGGPSPRMRGKYWIFNGLEKVKKLFEAILLPYSIIQKEKETVKTIS